MRIDFIDASLSDIPRIRAIAERSWEEAYKSILSSEQIVYMLEMMYSDEQLERHFAASKYRYVLFRNGGGEMGFMGFEYDYEPETTKLHRLYLLPESQGQGVGKAGLDFLKKQVARYGNRKIILNVNKKNKALAFYRSQGFEVYGEGIFNIGGGR